MSGESERLYVKMDVDMSDFDRSIDKMNDRLKQLKNAVASVQNSLNVKQNNLFGQSAADTIRDAVSGIPIGKTEDEKDTGETSDIVVDTLRYGISSGTSGVDGKKIFDTDLDTAEQIKREVENEFARQASKLARI